MKILIINITFIIIVSLLYSNIVWAGGLPEGALAQDSGRILTEIFSGKDPEQVQVGFRTFLEMGRIDKGQVFSQIVKAIPPNIENFELLRVYKEILFAVFSEEIKVNYSWIKKDNIEISGVIASGEIVFAPKPYMVSGFTASDGKFEYYFSYAESKLCIVKKPRSGNRGGESVIGKVIIIPLVALAGSLLGLHARAGTPPDLPQPAPAVSAATANDASSRKTFLPDVQFKGILGKFNKWLQRISQTRTGLPPSHIGDTSPVAVKHGFSTGAFTYDLAQVAMRYVRTGNYSEARKIILYFSSRFNRYTVQRLEEKIDRSSNPMDRRTRVFGILRLLPSPSDGRVRKHIINCVDTSSPWDEGSGIIEWYTDGGPQSWLGMAAVQLLMYDNGLSPAERLESEKFVAELADTIMGLFSPENIVSAGPSGQDIDGAPAREHLGHIENMWDHYAFLIQSADYFKSKNPQLAKLYREKADGILKGLKEKGALAREGNTAYFWQGFRNGQINRQIPTDVQAWGIASVGPRKLNEVFGPGTAEGMLNWLIRHALVLIDYVRPDGYQVTTIGADFSDPFLPDIKAQRGGVKAQITDEWTAGFILAIDVAMDIMANYYKETGRTSEAEEILAMADALRFFSLMRAAETSDGMLYWEYSTAYNMPTGYGWNTPQAHGGSLSGNQMLFALAGINPFDHSNNSLASVAMVRRLGVERGIELLLARMDKRHKFSKKPVIRPGENPKKVGEPRIPFGSGKKQGAELRLMGPSIFKKVSFFSAIGEGAGTIHSSRDMLGVRTVADWNGAEISFTNYLNLSGTPYLTLKVKAGKGAKKLRINVVDKDYLLAQDWTRPPAFVEADLTGDNTWHTVTVNLNESGADIKNIGAISFEVGTDTAGNPIGAEIFIKDATFVEGKRTQLIVPSNTRLAGENRSYYKGSKMPGYAVRYPSTHSCFLAGRNSRQRTKAWVGNELENADAVGERLLAIYKEWNISDNLEIPCGDFDIAFEIEGVNYKVIHSMEQSYFMVRITGDGIVTEKKVFAMPVKDKILIANKLCRLLTNKAKTQLLSHERFEQMSDAQRIEVLSTVYSGFQTREDKEDFQRLCRDSGINPEAPDGHIGGEIMELVDEYQGGRDAGIYKRFSDVSISSLDATLLPVRLIEILGIDIDINSFVQKLTKPENTTQVVLGMASGGRIDMEMVEKALEAVRAADEDISTSGIDYTTKATLVLANVWTWENRKMDEIKDIIGKDLLDRLFEGLKTNGCREDIGALKELLLRIRHELGRLAQIKDGRIKISSPYLHAVIARIAVMAGIQPQVLLKAYYNDLIEGKKMNNLLRQRLVNSAVENALVEAGIVNKKGMSGVHVGITDMVAQIGTRIGKQFRDKSGIGDGKKGMTYAREDKAPEEIQEVRTEKRELLKNLLVKIAWKLISRMFTNFSGSISFIRIKERLIKLQDPDIPQSVVEIICNSLVFFLALLPFFYQRLFMKYLAGLIEIPSNYKWEIIYRYREESRAGTKMPGKKYFPQGEIDRYIRFFRKSSLVRFYRERFVQEYEQEDFIWKNNSGYYLIALIKLDLPESIIALKEMITESSPSRRTFILAHLFAYGIGEPLTGKYILTDFIHDTAKAIRIFQDIFTSKVLHTTEVKEKVARALLGLNRKTAGSIVAGLIDPDEINLMDVPGMFYKNSLNLVAAALYDAALRDEEWRKYHEEKFCFRIESFSEAIGIIENGHAGTILIISDKPSLFNLIRLCFFDNEIGLYTDITGGIFYLVIGLSWRAPPQPYCCKGKMDVHIHTHIGDNAKSEFSMFDSLDNMYNLVISRKDGLRLYNRETKESFKISWEDMIKNRDFPFPLCSIIKTYLGTEEKRGLQKIFPGLEEEIDAFPVGDPVSDIKNGGGDKVERPAVYEFDEEFWGKVEAANPGILEKVKRIIATYFDTPEERSVLGLDAGACLKEDVDYDFISGRSVIIRLNSPVEIDGVLMKEIIIKGAPFKKSEEDKEFYPIEEPTEEQVRLLREEGRHIEYDSNGSGNPVLLRFDRKDAIFYYKTKNEYDIGRKGFKDDRCPINILPVMNVRYLKDKAPDGGDLGVVVIASPSETVHLAGWAKNRVGHMMSILLGKLQNSLNQPNAEEIREQIYDTAADIMGSYGLVLRKFHDAGYTHGNPHSGNVVVDMDSGEAHIVDLTDARLKSEMTFEQAFGYQLRDIHYATSDFMRGINKPDVQPFAVYFAAHLLRCFLINYFGPRGLQFRSDNDLQILNHALDLNVFLTKKYHPDNPGSKLIYTDETLGDILARLVSMVVSEAGGFQKTPDEDEKVQFKKERDRIFRHAFTYLLQLECMTYSLFNDLMVIYRRYTRASGAILPFELVVSGYPDAKKVVAVLLSDLRKKWDSFPYDVQAALQELVPSADDFPITSKKDEGKELPGKEADALAAEFSEMIMRNENADSGKMGAEIRKFYDEKVLPFADTDEFFDALIDYSIDFLPTTIMFNGLVYLLCYFVEDDYLEKRNLVVKRACISKLWFMLNKLYEYFDSDRVVRVMNILARIINDERVVVLDDPNKEKTCDIILHGMVQFADEFSDLSHPAKDLFNLLFDGFREQIMDKLVPQLTNFNITNNVSTPDEVWDILFGNGQNAIRFFKLTTMLRGFYPYKLTFNDPKMPLQYALENNIIFQIGPNLYVSPVTESFRRHLVFAKNDDGSIKFAFEVIVPGMEKLKKYVYTERRTKVADELLREFPEEGYSVKPLFRKVFEPQEVDLYGIRAVFTEQEPLEIIAFSYDEDGKRLEFVTSSVLDAWANQLEWPREKLDLEIAGQVAEITAAIHAMGYIGHNGSDADPSTAYDLHTGNFRVSVGEGKVKVGLVGDFEAFIKSGSLEERNVDVKAIIDGMEWWKNYALKDKLTTISMESLWKMFISARDKVARQDEMTMHRLLSTSA